MFGYATNETPEFMPLPISLAHRIIERIDRARHTNTIPFLRPDGKTQVTIRYEDWKPVAIEKIVVAVPHHPSVTREEVAETLYQHIIQPLIESVGLPYTKTESTYIVNGTGPLRLLRSPLCGQESGGCRCCGPPGSTGGVCDWPPRPGLHYGGNIRHGAHPGIAHRGYHPGRV